MSLGTYLTPSRVGWHGERSEGLQTENLRLSEIYYHGSARTRPHYHDRSFFFVVRQGAVLERYGAKEFEYKPSTMFYMHSDERHAERFDNLGTVCFVIELNNSWLERVSHRAAQVDFVGFNGGMATWLAARVSNEFRSRDEAARLVIEGLILELIAEVSKSKSKTWSVDRHPPFWVNRAKDLIHGHFVEQITNETIATEVGVHPAHLARGFRTHLHCTVGDYVRKLRVEFASREILSTNKTLTQIAQEAGFYDQSHFSRRFKELIGITPSQYRSIGGRR
jgi:AraC family transcriptional regulator